jgi:hypothetical protein
LRVASVVESFHILQAGQSGQVCIVLQYSGVPNAREVPERRQVSKSLIVDDKIPTNLSQTWQEEGSYDWDGRKHFPMKLQGASNEDEIGKCTRDIQMGCCAAFAANRQVTSDDFQAVQSQICQVLSNVLVCVEWDKLHSNKYLERTPTMPPLG